MKLAITSRGTDPDGEVDPRFGRARYFIFYDTETEEFEVLDNADQAGADQGAGVQAAQNVASGQAKALLTGHCGPKAFEVLSAAGIKVYSGIEGTVRDAVEAWKQGDLQLLEGPDGSPQH
jgi:predicted Fe-Mo cluster-binding NifX family protein